MRLNAAPEATPGFRSGQAFGGDLHRVGCHGERGDAKPLEVRLPGRGIGKLFVGVFRQAGDDGPGEHAPAHVAQCRVVDHVIGVFRAQQVKEVQSALALGGAEPGKGIVADLRAEAVAGFVPCPGVIHRDPAGALQPGAQHIARFGEEVLLIAHQQPHHLPL